MTYKKPDIARKMVCQWGMSEVLGPISVGTGQRKYFLVKRLGIMIASKRCYLI